MDQVGIKTEDRLLTWAFGKFAPLGYRLTYQHKIVSLTKEKEAKRKLIHDDK